MALLLALSGKLDPALSRVERHQLPLSVSAQGRRQETSVSKNDVVLSKPSPPPAADSNVCGSLSCDVLPEAYAVIRVFKSTGSLARTSFTFPQNKAPVPDQWETAHVCEQEVGEEWADFDFCSLVGDSPTSTTEVLLVDAHLFHDIIYPGVDLCYSMEVGLWLWLRLLLLPSPCIRRSHVKVDLTRHPALAPQGWDCG